MPYTTDDVIECPVGFTAENPYVAEMACMGLPAGANFNISANAQINDPNLYVAFVIKGGVYPGIPNDIVQVVTQVNQNPPDDTNPGTYQQIAASGSVSAECPVFVEVHIGGAPGAKCYLNSFKTSW